MKLGLQLGYWGAQPPENHGELVAAAEAAGFDAVFTAEAWGSGSYSPLAWGGSWTRRVRLSPPIPELQPELHACLLTRSIQRFETILRTCSTRRRDSEFEQPDPDRYP